jgi:hypothetical protein
VREPQALFVRLHSQLDDRLDQLAPVGVFPEIVALARLDFFGHEVAHAQPYFFNVWGE